MESRTTKSTPAVFVITSGANDEPPIPHSTTRLSPLAFKSADKEVSSGISAKLVWAASTHPNLIEDSASASLPQSVWSLAKRRDATWSLTSSGTYVFTASETFPLCETLRVI